MSKDPHRVDLFLVLLLSVAWAAPAVAAKAVESGEVVLLGTIVGTPGEYGNPSCSLPCTHDFHAVFDGDPSNHWGANIDTGMWAGMDNGTGTAPVLTRLRIVGVKGNPYDLTRKLVGLTVQGSNHAACASGAGFNTIYTIPAGTYLKWTNVMSSLNEIVLGNATGYRCVRIAGAPGYYGAVGEAQFIAQYAAGVSAKPVAVVISPWGGRFPALSSMVTMTSLTTSAAIYYTTDGTEPTNLNGTLYAGPFALTMTAGATTTVKAVAYQSALSTPLSDVSTSYFSGYGYKAGDQWYDQSGNPFDNHGPRMVYTGGLYYAFGISFDPDLGIGGANGIWYYTTPDLLNWTGPVKALDPPAGIPWAQGGWVLYSDATSKWVMWNHCSGNTACIATASDITGPWTWGNLTLNPDGLGLKDFSLFKDDDGTGYLTYVDGGQAEIVVSRLNPDFLGTTGAHSIIMSGQGGGGRESALLFKRQGTYFLVTSSENFFNQTLAFDMKYIYCTDTTPLCNSGGTPAWSASNGMSPLGGLPLVTPNPCPAGVCNNYNAQITSIFKDPKHVDAYIAVGDLWNKSNLYQSTQTWLPLSFPTATSVQALTPEVWDPSYFQNIPRRPPLPVRKKRLQ